jgi:predicted nucleic acid-binding protein
LVVLDAWALLAYLRDEPAAERVEAEWLESGAAICTINLGEALYIRIRERDKGTARGEIRVVRRRAEVVEVDWKLVRAAAEIKAGGGLSYADSFCVATARQLDSPLWTGDPEIVERADRLRCKVVDLRDAS